VEKVADLGTITAAQVGALSNVAVNGVTGTVANGISDLTINTTDTFPVELWTNPVTPANVINNVAVDGSTGTVANGISSVALKAQCSYFAIDSFLATNGVQMTAPLSSLTNSGVTLASVTLVNGNTISNLPLGVYTANFSCGNTTDSFTGSRANFKLSQTGGIYISGSGSGDRAIWVQGTYFYLGVSQDVLITNANATLKFQFTQSSGANINMNASSRGSLIYHGGL
jgi:hypothetical protein